MSDTPAYAAAVETLRDFCSDARIATPVPMAWQGYVYACDSQVLLRIPTAAPDELPPRLGSMYAMSFDRFPDPATFLPPRPPLYRIEDGWCVFCRGIAKGPCDFCGGTRLNFAGPYDQLAGISIAYGYAHLLRQLPNLRVAAGVATRVTQPHLAFTFTGGQGLLASIKE
jgi:hypothetical protein